MKTYKLTLSNDEVILFSEMSYSRAVKVAKYISKLWNASYTLEEVDE